MPIHTKDRGAIHDYRQSQGRRLCLANDPHSETVSFESSSSTVQIVSELKAAIVRQFGPDFDGMEGFGTMLFCTASHLSNSVMTFAQHKRKKMGFDGDKNVAVPWAS